MQVQATEEQIRAKLDGTFTRVLRAGEVRTKRVPLDFIPTHRNKAFGNRHATKVCFGEQVPLKPFRAPLTDEERVVIANLVADGVPIRGIARRTGRQPGVISTWIARMKQGEANAAAG